MSSELRVTDPKTGGQKGVKLERFDLIPYDAAEELARVYGFGAEKYSDDNWIRGYRWRLSAGALLRHVSRWMQGESYDLESGRHHLAHAAWHCFTLMTFEMRGLGTDDRKPPEMRGLGTADRKQPELSDKAREYGEKLKAKMLAKCSNVPPEDRPTLPGGWHPVKFQRGDSCEDPGCVHAHHYEQQT